METLDVRSLSKCPAVVLEPGLAALDMASTPAGRSAVRALLAFAVMATAWILWRTARTPAPAAAAVE